MGSSRATHSSTSWIDPGSTDTIDNAFPRTVRLSEVSNKWGKTGGSECTVSRINKDITTGIQAANPAGEISLNTEKARERRAPGGKTNGP